MANEAYLDILRSGVNIWNRWRIAYPDRQPNLSGAILSGAALNGADLRGARLFEAGLIGANLYQADLEKADLSGADLREADLREANLRQADLYRADLSGADLRKANLREANLRETTLYQTALRGADLSRATLGGTSFINMDLRQIIGLIKLNHWERSYIDIHTFHRSQGQISDLFLRGCGLNDAQIEMVKLHNPALTLDQLTHTTNNLRAFLAGGAPEYPTCFISYSSLDHALAERLYTDLQDNGIRCWFAPEPMKIGGKIRPSLDEAIRAHHQLILVLSTHAIASQWIANEIAHALAVEQQQKKVILYPIRLDDAVLECEDSWAEAIQRTHPIGDFSDWQEDTAYQVAFQRLLGALVEERAEP